MVSAPSRRYALTGTRELPQNRRAAETPAELLGAFALGWFLLALAAPHLVRRLGARPGGLLVPGGT
jgi:hypothetical protein